MSEVTLFDKGSVMLQTTYLSKPYQLEMTIPQACICLAQAALNEAEKVTL